MKKRKITCIVCPLGCELHTEYDEQKLLSLTGNKCPRGEAYAKEELFHPMRMVTTTVRILNADLDLIPVKTTGPVAKAITQDIIKEAAKLCLTAPVKLGDTVINNIRNTGVDLVATRTLEAVNQ